MNCLNAVEICLLFPLLPYFRNTTCAILYIVICIENRKEEEEVYCIYTDVYVYRVYCVAIDNIIINGVEHKYIT